MFRIKTVASISLQSVAVFQALLVWLGGMTTGACAQCGQSVGEKYHLHYFIVYISIHTVYRFFTILVMTLCKVLRSSVSLTVFHVAYTTICIYCIYFIVFITYCIIMNSYKSH